MSERCETCKAKFERRQLRPYGPGGSLICHPCGMKPENLAGVEAQLAAILLAPGHTIQTANGLVKTTTLDPAELIQQAVDLQSEKSRH